MRIGALKPIDVETPHGTVRVASRYRADLRCYRLRLYGPSTAAQWLVPKRKVQENCKGMAMVEISHHAQPITTIAELDQFRKELLARWEERLELGADDPALIHLAGSCEAPQTLKALVERYFTVHQVHLRTHTVETHRVAIRHVLDHILGSTPLAGLTADSIKLCVGLIAKRTSPAWANGCLRVLKAVLNYGIREGYTTNLAHQRALKLVAPAKQPVWWSAAEVAQVLAAAMADTKAARDAHLLFSLALYLGLRKGEIDRLRWEDLSLDGDRTVCVVRSTSSKPTKSGKARHVPICKELRAILQTYRQASGWVVRPENEPGKWLYRFEPDALYRRVVKAAKVTRIRFHDMRHTFTSLMLGAGASLFKVSRWLGHSDVRVTQDTYAHLAPYDAEVDLLTIGPVSASEQAKPATILDSTLD